MQIKLFKTKKNFKKKNLELNPNFYWKLIICLTFILAFVSFTFGYYFFIRIKEEPTFSAENTNKKQVIEKERLEKVLEYFSTRKETSREILNSPVPVVDPSL